MQQLHAGVPILMQHHMDACVAGAQHHQGQERQVGVGRESSHDQPAPILRHGACKAAHEREVCMLRAWQCTILTFLWLLLTTCVLACFHCFSDAWTALEACTAWMLEEGTWTSALPGVCPGCDL